MSPQEAAQKILAGDLVVFPTETVYGLGALAENDAAVKRIYSVKGRPSNNPLILHIATQEQLLPLVQEIPTSARKLIEHFWPGPLTICFRKSDMVSGLVSGGLDTVCVRQPHHPIAQAFLEAVGKAVAAPSANMSGKPSATTHEDAHAQLESKGVFFLDGGKAPLGLESTIVDCSGQNVALLRPGSITIDQLSAVLGTEILEKTEIDSGTTPMSPGQLLEHYAPHGELFVIYGPPEKRKSWIEKHIHIPSEWTLGTFSEHKDESFGASYFLASSESDLPAYAAELYAFLNWCDRHNAQKILLELPSSTDPLLIPLLNRLKKASRGRVLSL